MLESQVYGFHRVGTFRISDTSINIEEIVGHSLLLIIPGVNPDASQITHSMGLSGYHTGLQY